jgi:hypothetical protein
MNNAAQFRLLVRTFFDDFVTPTDEDSENDERTSLLPYVLGALIGPGAFFCFYELPRYADIRIQLAPMSQQGATIEAKFFLVTFTIVAVGFFMAWRWDSLLVEERDYLVLGPLPIHPGIVFAAKFAALLMAVGAITLCVNAVPLIAFPALASVGGVSPFASYMVHVVVILAAAVFTLAFFLGAQVLLLNVMSYRLARRFAPIVQIASSGVLAFMLLMAVDSSSAVAQVHRPDTPLLRLLPPFWFVGLYQRLLGHGDHVWNAMAFRAQSALGILIDVSAVMIAITYARHMKQVLEAKPGGTTSRAPAAMLTRLVARQLARTPVRRAGCEFVLLTLLRSHRHRLVFASFMALALAFSLHGGVIAVAGLAERDDPAIGVLSAPLVLSFFTMLGILWAMTMPTGGRARWVFDVAAEGHRAEVVAGARRAFLAISIGLPTLAAIPLFLWRFPLSVALDFLLTTTLLIWLASSIAARLVRSIPFIRREQRFRPPQLSLVIFSVWFAFTMYSYFMARLELWAAHSFEAMSILCALSSMAATLAMRRPVAYDEPIPEWWTKEEGLLLVEVNP